MSKTLQTKGDTQGKKYTDSQTNRKIEEEKQLVSCCLFHLKSFKLIVAAFLESGSADFEKKII